MGNVATPRDRVTPARSRTQRDSSGPPQNLRLALGVVAGYAAKERIMAFVSVGKSSEVQPGQVKQIELANGTQVCLANAGGKFYAIGGKARASADRSARVRSTGRSSRVPGGGVNSTSPRVRWLGRQPERQNPRSTCGWRAMRSKWRLTDGEVRHAHTSSRRLHTRARSRTSGRRHGAGGCAGSALAPLSLPASRTRHGRSCG